MKLNTFDQTIVSFSFLPLHGQKWENHHKPGLLISHLDFTGEEGRGAKGPSAYTYLHDPPSHQLDPIFTL
jgi:hypothetical protein